MKINLLNCDTMNLNNYITNTNPQAIVKQLAVVCLGLGFFDLIGIFFKPLTVVMVAISGIGLLVMGAVLLIARMRKESNPQFRESGNTDANEDNTTLDIAGVNIMEIAKSSGKNPAQIAKDIIAAQPIPYKQGMAVSCKKCHKVMTSSLNNDGNVELYCPNCGRHLIANKKNIKIPIQIINEGKSNILKTAEFIGAGANNVANNLTDKKQ
jgi:predicted RNA-binding Zn-ribbon protein involved in translation (DUF1610 family)